MKKLNIILLLQLVFVTTNAQVLFRESFNYSTGFLSGNAGWIQVTPTTTGATKVVSNGLTYTNYSTNTDNAAKIIYNSNPGDITYSPIGTTTSSGSIYVSFLVNISAANTSTVNPYFISIGNQATSNNGISLLCMNLGGSVSFGIRKANGSFHFGGGNKALNTTHLIILKYTFNTTSSTDDEAALFINPTSLVSEPISPTVSVISEADFTGSFTDFSIRGNGGTSTPTAVIDEIHISNNWADLFSTINGFNTYKEQKEVLVFPNPANDFLTIKLNNFKNFELRIISIDGKILLSKAVINSTEEKLPIQHLPSGIYWLAIISNEAKENQQRIFLKN